jgi:predicted dehydrogenase
MNDSIGIGIIGCGLIGETHAQCLVELGEGGRLFFDIDPARASELAEKYGGKVAKSAEELIASPEIAAVYICTHHDTHAPLAVLAAQHGKHIFLEKPMALTEADCRRIVEAVDRGKVRCMTGFKLRFNPLATRAEELIPKPTLIVAHILDNRWPDDSWANDPIKGGGNVLSQGCHAVDLVCEFARSKPIRVFGEGGNLHHKGIDITDTLAMTLTFANGTVASVVIADAGESPVVGKFSFQLFDGAHSLHLFDRMKQLVYTDGKTEKVFTEFEELGFMNENSEFLSAIRGHRSPSSDHYAGLRATLILLKAIESARTHQSITLDSI